jgi:hypothetical protein
MRYEVKGWVGAPAGSAAYYRRVWSRRQARRHALALAKRYQDEDVRDCGEKAERGRQLSFRAGRQATSVSSSKAIVSPISASALRMRREMCIWERPTTCAI